MRMDAICANCGERFGAHFDDDCPNEKTKFALAPENKAPAATENVAVGPWTPWLGGECPVAKGTLVDVRFRDGHELQSVPAQTTIPGAYEANGYFWKCDRMHNDIIAYRVVYPQAPADTLLAHHHPRTAPQLLAKAAELMEQRGKQYDQPQGERSMGKTVAAFNIITGRDLTESEGWLLLQILKDVRDRQTKAPHVDSLEDGIAYSALKAEARLGEAS